MDEDDSTGEGLLGNKSEIRDTIVGRVDYDDVEGEATRESEGQEAEPLACAIGASQTMSMRTAAIVPPPPVAGACPSATGVASAASRKDFLCDLD